MQVHVKTPRIKIDISGDIPDSLIAVLKKEYGKKLAVSDDDEFINVKDTAWYNKIKSEITPGETVAFYRKMHKMTQKELGEKIGNFSKQNVSEIERNIRPISKKTAKLLSEIFDISIDSLI
jgi:DNA-binding XRE family transcriptional regulator